MEIIWMSAIDPSGYSSCARSYIRALHQNPKCDVKTFITNVAYNINLQGIDREEIGFFSSLATTNTSKCNNLVNHCVPDRMVFSPLTRNILYTVCEMDIPERWIKICNSCDIIMTPSNFSRDIFIKNGVDEDRIFVIPHCHDSKVWNKNVKPLNINNLKSYNFLFVGDYTPRKGGDILIKNYIRAFQKNKNVSLTIKAYFNSFSKEDQNGLIKRIDKIICDSGIPRHEVPDIFFYGEPICEKLMPRFMQSFDCLVSPHHGEGWGLSISQMMALGKPTISTKYSGNLDFMNEKNSYLIDVDGFEKVSEEMSKINVNFKDKEWIKINEDSLVEKMRYVVLNKEASTTIGEVASNNILKNFSFEIVSDQIIKVLK